MGPLHGTKVIEMAGIGPAPFGAMMLADMGAEVLRVDRPSSAATFAGDPRLDLLNRGKRSLLVDLKNPGGIKTVLRLCQGADVLVEGFRPGVMERLGLSPEACFQQNPRLIYGRMTGFGQQGPLSRVAGHDLNFIALSGALHAFGRKDQPPTPPLNLVGDFGGGGMMLAFGVVCALLEVRRSGIGQVVDAAMVDGTATLLTMFYGMLRQGLWQDQRGVNLLDSGAPFYDTYRTKDDRWVSIGPLEPHFYQELIVRAGLDPQAFQPQYDLSRWDHRKALLGEVFSRKTRDEWCALLEGTDACFAPVLSLLEAPEHPHARERGTYIQVDGVLQPAPAPRFSKTPPEVKNPPPAPGQDSTAALSDWGFTDEEIADLRATAAIA